jgi:predicted nucleotidyltransferase
MKRSIIKKQIISTFKKFDPEKIILFGSATREDWDEESDVDIIVVYDTDKPFLARLEELYMSWDIPKAVDILAYTPSEYNVMAVTNYFLKDVLNSGEIIYERI